ncbi:hypothetical protein ABZ714_08845 [Streptomyces sp. NPDC006798]|uniref:hypothetical protein n=1 Tax=Streptomyces sp. NPDC006798 TaxID=3155462 RepID=UPI0033DE1B81
MSNTTARADVRTAPAQWAAIPGAGLAAHPGNLRDVQVPAALPADITADGVVEPFCVVPSNGDGRRRSPVPAKIPEGSTAAERPGQHPEE